MLRLVVRQKQCLKLGPSAYGFRYTWPSSERSILSHETYKACLARRTFTSTSSLLADITLTVDGKEVTVPQGILPESLRLPILRC